MTNRRMNRQEDAWGKPICFRSLMWEDIIMMKVPATRMQSDQHNLPNIHMHHHPNVVEMAINHSAMVSSLCI